MLDARPFFWRGQGASDRFTNWDSWWKGFSPRMIELDVFGLKLLIFLLTLTYVGLEIVSEGRENIIAELFLLSELDLLISSSLSTLSILDGPST